MTSQLSERSPTKVHDNTSLLIIIGAYKMDKEKLLTVLFMTIVSIACAFVGWNVFDVFFASADIGVALGFLFPTLVIYWISKLFPSK